jgi:hypothetical protein
MIGPQVHPGRASRDAAEQPISEWFRRGQSAAPYLLWLLVVALALLIGIALSFFFLADLGREMTELFQMALAAADAGT